MSNLEDKGSSGVLTRSAIHIGANNSESHGVASGQFSYKKSNKLETSKAKVWGFEV